MTYLALLRAINVGGHTVKMADLQQLFVEMNLLNVSTYIQSGNVFFDSSEDEATLRNRIQDTLHAKLGYEVITFLRTTAEMKRVVEGNPFTEEVKQPGMNLYVGYLQQPPSDELTKLLQSLRTSVDTFATGDREIYWLYDKTSGVSAFTRKPLEKQIKTALTMRNWNVTQKLAELAALRRE